MKIKMALLMSVIAVLAPSLASAETDWPDFMSQLEPGQSASPVAVIIPTDVVVKEPGTEVSKERAKWSGSWSGWACRKRSCDTRLIVEKVTTDGATVVYMFASDRVEPYSARVEATFVGDELQATFPEGDANIAYRMNSENVLWFKWERGDRWAAGILSR